MKKNVLSGLYAALKDMLFPAVCLLCHQGLGRAADVLLCPDCAAQMPLIRPPVCSCCGREFPDAAAGNHLCGTCLMNPPSFGRARAIFRYNKFTAPLIYSFKYRGCTTAMRTFTVLLASVPALGELCEKPDLIIPVPLHKKRLRQRGFNQALELARLFFPQDRRRIQPTILLRSRWTTPQTGLDGKQRRRNLAGAFQVRDARRIQGRRVLLIDDVLTTGSTVNECARVLRQNGAGNVEVLTLARVFA